MPSDISIEQRVQHLIQAFGADGYDCFRWSDNPAYAPWTQPQSPLNQALVLSEDPVDGSPLPPAVALWGCHRTARTWRTGEAKPCYYLEGTPRQMGFLMGIMAEPAISQMTGKFVDRVIFELVDGSKVPPTSKLFQFIQKMVGDFLGAECLNVMKPDVPSDFQEELEGMLAGCRRINPGTTVDESGLYALNFGIDFLLAHLFTGDFFKKLKIPASLLKPPVLCNAFSVWGDDAVEDGKHFFGRDFMFATADIYQDLACLMIYRSRGEHGRLLPIAAQAAPGMVGVVGGINTRGLAMGVDVFFGSFCNPDRPGFNSLALVRDTLQHAGTMDEAVAHVRAAPRGVNWFYPLAASTQTATGWRHDACVIEAGALNSGAPSDLMADIDKHFSRHLPTPEVMKSLLEAAGEAMPQDGMVVRKSDFVYPQAFLAYNADLYRAYNKYGLRRILDAVLDLIKGVVRVISKPSLAGLLRILAHEVSDWLTELPYPEDSWGRLQYINIHHDDTGCPGPFYFAPQRETRGNLVLVGNHAIHPAMRCAGMAKWVSTVTGSHVNEHQWRYDELNHQLLTAMETGGIDEAKARQLINFLRPDNDNLNTDARSFYNPGFEHDPAAIVIEGSVSLMELTEGRISTHTGYYGDAWYGVTLPNFL